MAIAEVRVVNRAAHNEDDKLCSTTFLRETKTRCSKLTPPLL